MNTAMTLRGRQICGRSLLALIAVVTTTQAAELPLPADPPRFDIWEYRVLGNSTLPASTIEKVIYPHLGERRSMADVDSVRQELETVYRNAGYGTVFVDIPEQSVDEGIVRLRVTEGRLDRVRITGARYFSNNQIRSGLPALASGEVPSLPQVQEQLAALNRRTSDRTVIPVLRAGRVPGTVDVELKVEDELPVHGSLELNDRYTSDTSRWRLNASLSYGNLFQRQQTLSLQYQTAPENPEDVQAIVGSYVFRIAPLPNTTMAVYAVDSSTDVAALGTLSVIGDGRIFGLRAFQSLPERPGYVQNLSLGLDYKDFLEDIRLQDANGLVTPIRYLNWSVAYSGTLTGEAATNAFNVAANFGLRNLVNDSIEFSDKRYKGSPNYFYIRGGAEHLRQLPWGLKLFGRLAAQFSQNPLVSNEQFAIGGTDTVRGYLESSELGDYGASGTVELRSAWLLRSLQLSPDAAHLYAFYDGGIVSILKPLPSQTSRFDLSSVGLGIRVKGWQGLDVGLDWAQALQDTGTIEAGDQRTHFSFRYAF